MGSIWTRPAVGLALGSAAASVPVVGTHPAKVRQITNIKEMAEIIFFAFVLFIINLLWLIHGNDYICRPWQMQGFLKYFVILIVLPTSSKPLG
jgi:hypothetical protein